MIRILACVCLVVCLAGSTLVRSQETKPNLTGKWILNMKLSKLDWPPPPSNGRKARITVQCCEIKSGYEIIDHKESNMTITWNVVELDEQGKERQAQAITKLTTDGSETLNEIFGDKTTITGRWNNDRLIINEAHENRRFPPNIEFRTLSKDGKTMTVETYVGQVQGQPVVTMVFERSDK